MSEIKYEIVKKIGVLSTSGSGWTKELNLISWNDRAPKYDLRDRFADREKMGSNDVQGRIAGAERVTEYPGFMISYQNQRAWSLRFTAGNLRNPCWVGV